MDHLATEKLSLLTMQQMGTFSHSWKVTGSKRQGMHSTIHEYASAQDNKTCHRDRIARLTVPCPSHKKL